MKLKRKPFSKGEVTMALASTLAEAGMPADWAMAHAIDSVQLGHCCDDLRAKIGDLAANALDLDLTDNLRTI